MATCPAAVAANSATLRYTAIGRVLAIPLGVRPETIIYRSLVIGLLGAMLLLHLDSERRDSRADATADARARLMMARTRLAPLPDAAHKAAPRTEETVVVDISRSALHRLSVTPNDTPQARLIPIIRMGSPVGVRIFDIVDGGLFATLGLENGDSILSVNDVPVTSPSVTDLRDLDVLPDVVDLSIRRRGEQVRIIALVHG